MQGAAGRALFSPSEQYSMGWIESKCRESRSQSVLCVTFTAGPRSYRQEQVSLPQHKRSVQE